jgi:hypothetical protein
MAELLGSVILTDGRVNLPADKAVENLEVLFILPSDETPTTTKLTMFDSSITRL